MATTRLPPDFSEFLKLLGDNHVEYLLIGGYAAIAHGYPRSTGDLDVWVGTDPVNAERVVDVFRQFGITAW